MEAQSGQDSAQECAAETETGGGTKGPASWGGRAEGPHREKARASASVPPFAKSFPSFNSLDILAVLRGSRHNRSHVTQREHELPETARRTQHHRHTEQSPEPLQLQPSPPGHC